MTKKSYMKPEPAKVICTGCAHFRRDTCGRNVSVDGVFFMGTCGRGHGDGGKKVFAMTKRVCNDYRAL